MLRGFWRFVPTNFFFRCSPSHVKTNVQGPTTRSRRQREGGSIVVCFLRVPSDSAYVLSLSGSTLACCLQMEKHSESSHLGWQQDDEYDAATKTNKATTIFSTTSQVFITATARHTLVVVLPSLGGCTEDGYCAPRLDLVITSLHLLHRLHRTTSRYISSRDFGLP